MRLRTLWIGVFLAALPTLAMAQRSERTDRTISAAGAECVDLDVEGLGTGTAELTGTWAGATVTFYVGGRNGTTNTVDAAKADTPGTAVNTATDNGIWQMPVAGYKTLQACVTTPGTGSIRVSLMAAGTGGGGGGGASGPGGSGDFDIATFQTTFGTNAIFLGTGADNVANTQDHLAFFPYVFDGSAWDRLVGNSTDGLTVNLGTNNDVTVTGSVTVTDGAGALNVIVDSGAVTISAGDNDIGNVDLELAGTAVSQTNPVAVRFSDGTNFISPATDQTEDAASAGGETGPMVLSVRRDTAASSAGTAGDFATFNTDGLGRLWTRDGSPCADWARITTAVVDTASSGNVEVVALNGSDLIYVCGYDLVADGAVAVQFIYGTGTACATGETDRSGPMSFAANGGIARTVTGAPQMVIPAGQAFCIENSTTGGIRGHVEYVRTAAP